MNTRTLTQVITPVQTLRAFDLQRCAHSVLSQTTPAWHHLVLCPKEDVQAVEAVLAQYAQRYFRRYTVQAWEPPTNNLIPATITWATSQVDAPVSVLPLGTTWHPDLIRQSRLAIAQNAVWVAEVKFVEETWVDGLPQTLREGRYSRLWMDRMPVKRLLHPRPFPLTTVQAHVSSLQYALNMAGDRDPLWEWRFLLHLLGKFPSTLSKVPQVNIHSSIPGKTQRVSSFLRMEMQREAEQAYMRYARPELHYLTLFFQDSHVEIPEKQIEFVPQQAIHPILPVEEAQPTPENRPLRDLYHKFVPLGRRIAFRDLRQRLRGKR